MEQRLLSGEPDADLLHAYHESLTSHQEIRHGRSMLDGLIRTWPANHQIRSIYIALCLQDGDQPGAMDAIEDLIGAGASDDGLLEAALSVRASLGPRTILKNASPSDSLSLCMIVKNEQAGLGACLNVIKGLVDEMIVVDTGSMDRTVDVARIFGAQTYFFPWCDDFSAARNFGLEKATGHWILILDADEVIAIDDQIRLKSLIQRHGESTSAFSLTTRNYTHLANAVGWQPNNRQYATYEAGIGWFPSYKVRLFPRLASIKFRYPIHEMVDPAIRESGIAILSCDIPIHHYGHLNEKRNREKAASYFRLGYAKLDQLGNDCAAIRELAVQAGQLEYWPEGLSLWQKLLKIDPDFAEGYLNAAGICWQMGQYRESLAYARHAGEMLPNQKEAHYNIAVSLLLLEKAEEAVSILQQLLEGHPGYSASEFMTAAALICAGHREQGRSMLKLLAQSPAGKGLEIAIQDLEQRFKNAGLNEYARNLKISAETCC